MYTLCEGPQTTPIWAKHHYIRTSGWSMLLCFIKLPGTYFLGQYLEALAAFPTEMVLLLWLIQMSYILSILLILFCPTYQETLLTNFVAFCAAVLWVRIFPPKTQMFRAWMLATGIMGSRWGLWEMRPNRRNLLHWRHLLKEMLGG